MAERTNLAFILNELVAECGDSYAAYLANPYHYFDMGFNELINHIHFELERHIKQEVEFLEKTPIFYEAFLTSRDPMPHINMTQKLFDIARLNGATAALQWFDKLFINEPIAEVYIFLLGGIQIPYTVQLTSDVWLTTINDLPESIYKNYLLNGIPFEATDLMKTTSVMPHIAWSAMKTALVFKSKRKPIQYAEDSAIEENNKLTEMHLLVEDMVLLLTTCCEYGIQILLSWAQYLDPDFNLSEPGTSFPLQPSYHSRWGVLDVKLIEHLAPKFIQLNKNSKDRIRLALKRLNNSKNRFAIEDIALELGIAYEILLSQKDETGDINWRVSYRAAWVYGNDLDSRKETRKIIKKLYDMRSHAVHRGHVENSQANHEILHAAGIICNALIRTFIEEGTIPNWADFELSLKHDT